VQRIPLDGAEDSEATVLEPEPEGPGSPLEMAALDLEDPAADAFRRTPLLGDLDPRALEALLGFARVIELADGELLQRTGDPAVGPYAVAHGAVVPFVETGFDDEEGPRRHEWRALEAGEFFGENALVSRAPERVCVRARGDVRLLWLPRQHLAAWIDGAPSRVRALLRLARRRLVDRLVETHPVLAPLATVPRDVLARECHLLEVEDGAAIVEQGRSAPAVFGVLSGRLSVVRSDEDREKIVAELESGELWGDSSTATGTPAPASVVAAGRAWVLEWPPDALRMRLGAAPGAHRGA
jgi:CRP-like cAMP-binding protein